MPSSGTTTSTTSTQADPWSGLQPFLSGTQGQPGLFNEAAGLYSGPAPRYYDNSTVAGIAPETNLAWNAATARGLQGSPLNMEASKYLTDSMQGKYTGGFLNGPGGDNVFANINSRVTPAVAAQFSKAGRYGSELHADTTARALTEAYAPFAMQGYQAERGLQQQAAGMAPQQAGQDYTDIGALEAVGTARQQQAQNLVNADVQRFDYNQNIPINQLARYAGLLQGQQIPPSQTQTMTGQQPSNLLGTLGGLGLSAAGLYGLLR